MPSSSLKYNFSGVHAVFPEFTFDEAASVEEDLVGVLGGGLPETTHCFIRNFVNKYRERTFVYYERPARDSVDRMLQEAESALDNIYQVFGESNRFIVDQEMLDKNGQPSRALDYISSKLIAAAFSSEDGPAIPLASYNAALHQLVYSADAIKQAVASARQSLSKQEYEEALVGPVNKADVREIAIAEFCGVWKYAFNRSISAHVDGDFKKCVEVLLKAVEWSDNRATYSIALPNEESGIRKTLVAARDYFDRFGPSKDYTLACWDFEEIS
ncbi:MAG: hypothetical protein MRY32_02745 [Rickettsiales bacterium]|nr:hypothetical protein [Rickettsiales bacterium]